MEWGEGSKSSGSFQVVALLRLSAARWRERRETEVEGAWLVSLFSKLASGCTFPPTGRFWSVISWSSDYVVSAQPPWHTRARQVHATYGPPELTP